MADLTREQLQDKVKRREPADRIDLRGLDLSKAQLSRARLRRADLEGANLEGAALRGADFKNASLREVFLEGADLREANLEGADLEGAKLSRARLDGANLIRTHLDGAELDSASLAGARLAYAQLDSASLGGADLQEADLSYARLDEAYLGGAKLRSALLRGADLHGANLEEADLTDVDARQANVHEAVLDRANLTGAKVAGLIGTGSPVRDVQVVWIDTSRLGDGSGRLTNGEIPALLSGGQDPNLDASARGRYFGRGDILRNAALTFAAGASVRVDGLLEGCAIELGEGTELVVGTTGALVDCTVSGPGRITVHGSFFESRSPGIVGPAELVVSATGAVAAQVQQTSTPTAFAFERGCALRMKIQQPERQ